MRLSLLTDNPPSPGKVGHTTAVYVRKVLLACRYFTSDKNQMSETSIATEKRPWEEVDLIIVLYLRITPGIQLQQGKNDTVHLRIETLKSHTHTYLAHLWKYPPPTREYNLRPLFSLQDL